MAIQLDRLLHASSNSSQGEVILVPEPSNDPLDPLNWPRWRKECMFWVLAFGGGLVSVAYL